MCIFVQAIHIKMLGKFTEKKTLLVIFIETSIRYGKKKKNQKELS